MNQTTAALIVCLLLLPSAGRAGAWVQEPGSAYVRILTGYLQTSERFDQHGNEIPYDSTRATEYKDVTGTLYAEVGVAPGWNLVGDVTWKYVEAVQPSALLQTWGFGDLRLGAKRSLTVPPGWVSAILGFVTIPTGYNEEEFPSLGSGVFEAGIGGALGTSGRFGWVNLDTFVKYRGGSFRNQIEGALGGGFGGGSRGGIRAELRGGLPYGPVEIDPGAFVDPNQVDPSWLDLAGVLSYRVTGGMALEVEARATPVGENTLQGVRWTVALATSPAWKWR